MMKLKVKLFGVLTAVSLGIVAPYASAEELEFGHGYTAYQERDYREASRIFRLLADEGDASAQYFLGRMYQNGEHVFRNQSEALSWYLLAANGGHHLAHFELGKRYESGYRLPQDYIRAHMLYNIAAAAGVDDARDYRDRVAEKLTPTGIEKAQQLATECYFKAYKGC